MRFSCQNTAQDITDEASPNEDFGEGCSPVLGLWLLRVVGLGLTDLFQPG